MKKKNRIFFIVILVGLIATSVVYTMHMANNIGRYIEENGKKNMETIVEQMKLTYESQIGKYYSDLQKVDRYLFPGDSRDTSLESNIDFLYACQQESAGKFLFLKEDGTAMTLDGKKSRLEIQSQLLMELKKGNQIAKLVAKNNSGNQEEGYIIAVPCEKYTVDGEEYTAMGALYERSQIGDLLEINGYGGKAYMFILDREGEVTYTNQESDNFLRNYNLLKHLDKDDALTEEQFDFLNEAFKTDKTGVRLAGKNNKQYYIGYTDLEPSDSELICIAAKSVVNNTLLDYQHHVVRALIVFGIIVLLLICCLVYSVVKYRIALQKAKFDKEKQLLREEAMRNLEIEKHKAEEANRSKSDFLANVSHDIRTPMNAIVGMTKLMEHDRNNPEKLELYISKLQSSSKHLLGLINDVLDMSKIEAQEIKLSREPISLADQTAQIDSIIRAQVEDRRQTFIIRVHEIVHEYLIGDATRMRQIFINLLSNAVKYTPEGGNISLDLAELPSEDENRATIEITVTDDGIGMAPEFIEHIFEPFTRAEHSVTNRTQGTGLGMAITKNIVDLMGGTITVESTLNEGSCFKVVISLEIDKEAKKKIEAEKVLLIATEESLIRNTTAAFKETEISLFIARNKVQSEEVLKAEDIDTILLAGHIHDEELAEIVKLLRSEAKHAVLVFCLDYEQQEQAYDILEEDGVDGLISRPFFLSNFANVVSRARNDEKPETVTETSIMNGMRFLCAEDNELNAEILEAILDLHGATCTIYPDGQKLVDKFAEVKPGEYDAILMDVQMPIMNGLDATREIRKSDNPLGREIPIIAMTANAFSSDIQDCLNAGMDAHLAKPMDVAALARTLKSLTSRN